MPTTFEAFTPDELHKLHPEGFRHAHARYVDSLSEIPWGDEIFDSLKAIVEACGARMRDYRIGAYSPCMLDVDAPGVGDDPRTWFEREVLRPHGYTPRGSEGGEPGRYGFPGVCGFTGVCFDENLAEGVYGRLCDGDSLTEALEGMADDARALLEAEDEAQRSEEYFRDAMADRLYTADGRRIA